MKAECFENNSFLTIMQFMAELLGELEGNKQQCSNSTLLERETQSRMLFHIPTVQNISNEKPVNMNDIYYLEPGPKCSIQ